MSPARTTRPKTERPRSKPWDITAEGESMIGGLAVTALLHLLLLWLLPVSPNWMGSLAGPTPNGLNRRSSHGEVYVVKFASPPPPATRGTPVPPEPPPPQQFVETNPEAPSNPPDQTPNFAARNQQSAQPDPAALPSPDRTPEVDGELENTPKIVSGDLFESAPEPPESSVTQYAVGGTGDGQPAAAARGQGDNEQPETPAPAAPPSAPRFLQADPREPTGEGIGSILKPAQGETNGSSADPTSDDRVISITVSEMSPGGPQGSAERGSNQPATGGTPAGAPAPLPRPRLLRKVAPGPLKQSPGGVTRVGAIAIDANFSEFGDYLQRMFDAIGSKWTQLNESASRSYAEVNSQVIVEFFVNREGSIEDLTVVHANADRLRTLFCEDAIKSRAPYGPWTSDMVRVLGERQPVRFTFYYR